MSKCEITISGININEAVANKLQTIQDISKDDIAHASFLVSRELSAMHPEQTSEITAIFNRLYDLVDEISKINDHE